MPRKRFRRKVRYKFKDTYYKPRGVPLNQLKEIEITAEELEVLRLKFIEKLHQIQAAEKLGISQSQYQRDYYNVLTKITKALINGWAIKIKSKADNIES